MINQEVQQELQQAQERLESLTKAPAPEFGLDSVRRAEELIEMLAGLQALRYELVLGY